MVTRRLEIHTITEHLGAAGILGQPLGYSKILTFDSTTRRVVSAVVHDASRHYKKGSRVAWWHRHIPGPLELSSVTVTLPPGRRSKPDTHLEQLSEPDSPTAENWREPLTLTWPVVRYRLSQGANELDAFLGFVPALGVQVIADSFDAVSQRLPDEVLGALRRARHTTLGIDLALLAERSIARLHTSVIDIDLPTPRQVLDQALAARSKKGPTALEQVSTLLHTQSQLPAYEVDDAVDRVAQALLGPPGGSVLIVGPSGVGKSAVIRQLVRDRGRLHLASTWFCLTSGSRLVAGMVGLGMWQERCLAVVQEAIQKQAVLVLGNLLELMEVGKSEHNSQGIASFFAPYCLQGQLRVIVECTPEQLHLIQAREPRLLEAFTQVDIAPPASQRCLKILRAVAAESSLAPRSVTVEPQASAALMALHDRYAGYSTNPGRPLTFLQSLLSSVPDQSTVTAQQVVDAFSAQSGLPLLMLDDAVPMDLARTREWFDQRVIGQPAATQAVTLALARAKARLTRPGRPIASLLFIGPTGVGKTETAKALAQFLFGAPERTIRVDMSEYADPWAAARLAGVLAGQEGYLTARVREQPFSVVLLDEFEKAHGDVFDLLLQILGEGRLTDASGRVADFSNAVVIMTSNLGADSYSQSSFGFSPGKDARAQAASHFLEHVRNHLRPELFNRIDSIIPFAPLDQDTALLIARREIQKLLQRDGMLERDITVDIDDHAAASLARAGFDPRYGARPLKRAIQDHLVAPLAHALSRYDVKLPLHAAITWPQEGLQVDIKPADTRPRPSEALLGSLAQSASHLRRSLQHIRQGPAFVALLNEHQQLLKVRDLYLKRLAKIALKPPPLPADAQAAKHARKQMQESFINEARLKIVSDLMRDFDSLEEKTHDLEQALLLAVCDQSPVDLHSQRLTLDSLRLTRHNWLENHYFSNPAHPETTTLMVFGVDRSWMRMLTRALLDAIPQDCMGRLMRLKVSHQAPPPSTPENHDALENQDSPAPAGTSRPVLPELADSPQDLLDFDLRPGVIGAAFEIRTPRVAALFLHLQGVFGIVFGPSAQRACLLQPTQEILRPASRANRARPVNLQDLTIDVARPSAFSNLKHRWTFDVPAGTLAPLTGNPVIPATSANFEQSLRHFLRALLDQQIAAHAGLADNLI